MRPPAPGSVRRLHEDFLAHCATDRALRPRSVQTYTDNLRWFEDWLATQPDGEPATLPAADVTARHIRGWLNATPISAATRALRLGTLRNVGDYGVTEGVLATNVARTLPSPKVRPPAVTPLSRADVAALLDGPLVADWLLPRDRALLELLYATGIRGGEIEGLDLADIDRDARLIRVRHGKGDKPRVVPIHDRALAALDAYLPLRTALAAAGTALGRDPGAAVFLGAQGTRMRIGGLRRVVKRRATEVGVSARIYLHVFRHTFSVHWLEERGDLRTLQQALGHANLNTTARYDATAATRLRDQYAEIHPRAKRPA